MLTATANPTNILRNYAIAATSVILLSVGLTDMFANPARVAQQDRLDSYGNYISVGLVAQAQNWGR